MFNMDRKEREQWRQLQSQFSVVMIALHQKNKNKNKPLYFDKDLLVQHRHLV